MRRLGLSNRPALLALAVPLVATTLLGCAPRHSVVGDQASARGEWKRAHESYVRAIEQEPDSTEVRSKLQNAKRQAIAQAIATIRSCELEHDSACVEREALFVLKHEPGNEEIVRARLSARADLSRRALENGRSAAARGDMVESVRLGREALEWQKGEVAQAAVSDMFKEIAPQAVAWAERSVEAEDVAGDRAVETLQGVVGVLSATISYVPEKAALLELARRRLSEAESTRRARAAEAAAREAALQARALADRSRLVSVVGAVVSPAKHDQRDWDGLGSKNAARAAKMATSLSLQAGGVPAPVGEVAGGVVAALAEPVADATSLPEPFGAAELFVGQLSQGVLAIPETKNSVNPGWSGLRWANVDITRARLRVMLLDRDLQDHDPIAVVEVGPVELAQAFDSGRVWWVRVDDQSQGQLLYLGVSVQ